MSAGEAYHRGALRMKADPTTRMGLTSGCEQSDVVGGVIDSESCCLLWSFTGVRLELCMCGAVQSKLFEG